MKNHLIVDGRLLQTNKKWSHLKQSQKAWICETLKKEYDNYTQKIGKIPGKQQKEELIDHVYAKIEEREIWIPFYEVKTELYKRIAKYNRQMKSNFRQQKMRLMKLSKIFDYSYFIYAQTKWFGHFLYQFWILQGLRKVK